MKVFVVWSSGDCWRGVQLGRPDRSDHFPSPAFTLRSLRARFLLSEQRAADSRRLNANQL
jgi:hypothetical protein